MYFCGKGETQFDEEQYCCLTNNQRVLPQTQRNYESTMPTQRIPNEKQILFSDFVSSKKNRDQASLREKVSLSKMSDKNKSKNRVPSIENAPSTTTHRKKPFQLIPSTPTPYYTQPPQKQHPPIPIPSYGVTPKAQRQQEKIYTNKVYFNAANINKQPTYNEKRENIKKFIDEYKQSAMNAPRHAPKRFAFEEPRKFQNIEVGQNNNRVTMQQIRQAQGNREGNMERKDFFNQKQGKSYSVNKNQEEKSEFKEIQEQEKLRKSSKVSLNRQKLVQSGKQRQQTQGKLKSQESKDQLINNSSVSNIFENLTHSSPRLQKKVHTAMSLYDESMISSQQAFMTRKSNNLQNMFSPIKNKGKQKMEESIVVMDFFNPPNKLRELIEEDLRNRKL